jgi:hypothetical protein
MTAKSLTEEKKLSAAPVVEPLGVNKRAKAAAVVPHSTKTKTKKVKASPEILTEAARYELARKEAEARMVRHDLRNRLQGRP